MIYSDTRHVQTVIPTELHKILRNFCTEHELTLTVLLSTIITEWINNNIINKESRNGQEKNDKGN